MGLFDFFSSKSRKVKGISDAALLAQLKPIIVDMLGVDEWEVVPQAELGNDLGCDELDFHELLIEIMNRLNYGIPPYEDKNIITVGDIMRVIRKYN